MNIPGVFRRSSTKRKDLDAFIPAAENDEQAKAGGDTSVYGQTAEDGWGWWVESFAMIGLLGWSFPTPGWGVDGRVLRKPEAGPDARRGPHAERHDV